jgi:signal peptidase I
MLTTENTTLTNNGRMQMADAKKKIVVVVRPIFIKRDEKDNIKRYKPGDVVELDATEANYIVATNRAEFYDKDKHGTAKSGDNIPPKKESKKEEVKK